MRQGRDRRGRRSGLATLELVLCMPILVALLVALYAVAEAALQKMDLVVRARHEAWAGRLDQPSGGDFPDANASPLDLPVEGPASRGLRTSSLIRPLQLRIGFQVHGFTALARHEVLSGTWDHRLIRFGEIGPLTLHDKAWIYAPDAGTTGMTWESLALGSGSAASILGRVGQGEAGVAGDFRDVQKALDATRDVIEDLKDQVEALTRTIERLNDRIAEAEDPGVRAQLETERKKAAAQREEKRRQIEEIRQHAGEAGQALGRLRGLYGDGK